MVFFKNRSTGFWTALGLLSIVGIGMVDFRLNHPVDLILLYLIPILICELAVGAEVGLFMTVFASVTWAVCNGTVAGSTTNVWVHCWNSVSTLVIFLLANGSMGLLRAAGLKETTALRSDPYSGLMNRMGFTEAVHREIARSRRQKKIFSLIFMNADGYKAFNARYGYTAGDHLIEVIGRVLKQGTRTSDLAARLDSDEFVAFLPEMDAETARMAMNRIQGVLNEAMSHRKWEMTFRLASTTFRTAPETLELFLEQAERAQFALRAANKNSIHHHSLD